MGFNILASEFPGLGPEGSKESSVDRGKFWPLIVGAIGVEGVIVLLLDDDRLWGSGSGKEILSIKVTVLTFKEEASPG